MTETSRVLILYRAYAGETDTPLAEGLLIRPMPKDIGAVPYELADLVKSAVNTQVVASHGLRVCVAISALFVVPCGVGGLATLSELPAFDEAWDAADEAGFAEAMVAWPKGSDAR